MCKTELDEIETITFVGIEETYDLEIDHPSHTFYANDISVSNSHAVAYAITSYQCAYLLNYFPDEWIASFLDFASTGKGKAASGEDPKTFALMEARTLGYRLGKPDINLSEDKFVVTPGTKTLVPSFSAIKGVGKAALYEIQDYRQYKTVKDLLINSDGSWRHSKFNKRAFGNLIKSEAFESMDIVGPGKIFENHKQMFISLVENYDLLKKTAARKKNNDVMLVLEGIIQETKNNHPEDWTKEEKIQHSQELTGNVDISLILNSEMVEYLSKAKIESIDSYENEDEFYWSIIDDCEIKLTKTNKTYMKLTFHGLSGTKYSCNIWNVDAKQASKFKANSICVGRYQKDNWGFKSFLNALKNLA